MDWKKATIDENGKTKIPERWLHLYYYEALNILFRFENALRVFVYAILKNELAEKWDLAAISDGCTIRSETKKRITQAKEHGYLGYEVSSPMLYLNSGELIQVITSEAYWKHFAPYFKASKSIVQTKLQEIGTVRNSLAHFRPIKEDDIDLIKQNSKHVLLEIENCLIRLTSISDVVPTNSNENWYKEIKSIGGETTKTSVYSSPDNHWIRIELSYRIPILEKTKYTEEYFSYKVGNIRTSQLLRKFSAIKNNCVYVSEFPVYGQLSENFDISASKLISIVFSRLILEKNLGEVVTAIKNIALTIDNETDLLLKDNLARGELVESVHASATVRDGVGGNRYWHVAMDNLNTALTEIDDVEFWGRRAHYQSDFISATPHYPWMPSSVSTADWFF